MANGEATRNLGGSALMKQTPLFDKWRDDTLCDYMLQLQAVRNEALAMRERARRGEITDQEAMEYIKVTNVKVTEMHAMITALAESQQRTFL